MSNFAKDYPSSRNARISRGLSMGRDCEEYIQQLDLARWLWGWGKRVRYFIWRRLVGSCRYWDRPLLNINQCFCRTITQTIVPAYHRLSKRHPSLKSHLLIKYKMTARVRTADYFRLGFTVFSSNTIWINWTMALTASILLSQISESGVWLRAQLGVWNSTKERQSLLWEQKRDTFVFSVSVV